MIIKGGRGSALQGQSCKMFRILVCLTRIDAEISMQIRMNLEISMLIRINLEISMRIQIQPVILNAYPDPVRYLPDISVRIRIQPDISMRI
jgi:hypothetical protein